MIGVSVILPTNRRNSDMMLRLNNIKHGLESINIDTDEIFTKEFLRLLNYRMEGIVHYLELTLRSLQDQRYKNFELIISHRHPEDALGIVKAYAKDVDFPIKLVREKPSIWHKLGDYPTLINNINTAIIYSSNELLWRLDDMVFFNEKVIKEFVRLYQFRMYGTSPVVKNISYDENIKKYKRARISGKTNNKYRYEKLGFRGIIKRIADEYSEIPMRMSWGYSSTVGIDDVLKINGGDELWDGSVSGTDIEFGERLEKVSSFKRVVTKNYVYELDDTIGLSKKNNIRNDEVFRSLLNKKNIVGNSWKPTDDEFKKYEEWHKKNIGALDKNWDKMKEVPFFSLKELYDKKDEKLIVFES